MTTDEILNELLSTVWEFESDENGIAWAENERIPERAALRVKAQKLMNELSTKLK